MTIYSLVNSPTAHLAIALLLLVPLTVHNHNTRQLYPDNGSETASKLRIRSAWLRIAGIIASTVTMAVPIFTNLVYVPGVSYIVYLLSIPVIASLVLMIIRVAGIVPWLTDTQSAASFSFVSGLVIPYFGFSVMLCIQTAHPFI